MKDRIKADIVEIFSSVQGEGIFLGAKQIFVRFKRCNMHCVFCDEPRDAKAKDYSPQDLIKKIMEIEAGSRVHHSVSFTGGEPLLYVDFLKDVLSLLRKEGMKSYLETNGTLPDELATIIKLTDIIAMDFKLPSSTRDREFWVEHERFLKLADRAKVFIKIIVTVDTTEKDIAKAASIVVKVDRNIPFILQPASPVKSGEKMVGGQKLFSFMDTASKGGVENIRVIPQIHKMLRMK